MKHRRQNSALESRRGLYFSLAMIFIMLLSVSGVLAFDFDNIKTYDPANETILIQNSIWPIGIPTSDVASLKLVTPHENYVMPGLDRQIAVIRVTNYDGSYSNAIQNMKLIDLNTNAEISRRVYYQINNPKTVQEPDYGNPICDVMQTLENGTQIMGNCQENITGYHPEQRNHWETLDVSQPLPTDHPVDIAVVTDVKNGDKGEWIMTAYGVQLTEWAGWTTALNNNLVAYYNMSTVEEYIFSVSNLTVNAGTPALKDDGIIGYGANMSAGNSYKFTPSASGVGNLSVNTSFNIWLKTNSAPATSDVFIDNYVGGGTGWVLQVDASTASSIKLVGWSGNIVCANAVYQNKWFDIAVRRNDTSIAMFLNGTECGGTTTVAGLPKLRAAIIFADNANFAGNAGTAIYDEFGWWTRVLTDTEIVQLYNNGAGISWNVTTPNPILGLTALNAAPANETNFTNVALGNLFQTFNTTATAVNGNFSSATLYIWNASNTIFNQTTVVVNGTANATSINASLINYPNGKYHWSVLWTAVNSTSSFSNFSNGGGNWTFNINDSVSPNVQIVYPSNANYSTNVSDLNYTVYDLNLQSCWYSLDNSTTNVTIVCGTNLTGQTSIEGWNTWKVWANDTANHVNVSTINFFKDTVKPNVLLVDPQDLNYSTNISILNYTVSDLNLQSCWYSTDNASTNVTGVCGNNATDLTSIEGWNTWWVWANDTVNNVNSSKVSFFKDTTNPQIKIIYPTAASYNYNVSDLNYTVYDANLQSCWYSINAGANTSIACGANLTGQTSVEGNNTWMVYSNDTLNNVNYSIVSFQKDSVIPVTAITNKNHIYFGNYVLINYTISDSHLDSAWYTFDFGVTNITFMKDGVQTDIINATPSFPNADSGAFSALGGLEIKVNKDVLIRKVMQRSDKTQKTALVCSARDCAGASSLGTAEFSGAAATFSNPVKLSSGSTYYILVNGTSETRAINTTVAFPVSSEYLNFTNGVNPDTGLLDSATSYDIVNVTFIPYGPLNISINPVGDRFMTIYANDTFGGFNSSSLNFTVFNGTFIFNPSVEETTGQNYNLTINQNQSLILNSARLAFNNTIYSIQNSSITYYHSLITPFVESFSTVKSFVYLFNATYGPYNEIVNSTVRAQTINQFLLSFCSGRGITFLNFTFADESSSAPLNATIDSSSWAYWLISSGQSYNKTMSFTNLTVNPSYAFCGSQNYSQMNSLYSVKYSSSQGGTYPQRTYSTLSVLSNSTLNKVLLLASSTVGQYVTFQVINPALQPLSGVSVVAMQGATIIDSKVTDSSGGAILWLEPTATYDMTFSKAGYTTFATSLNPSQTSYTITLVQIGGSNVTNVNSGTTYSMIPIDQYLNFSTNYTFSFGINSTLNSISAWGFNVTNSTGGVLYDFSSASNGGSQNASLNTSSYDAISINAFWTSGGTTNAVSRSYVMINLEGSQYSIFNAAKDLKNYVGAGMFGITPFALNIMIFLFILITVGITSWKFGIYSPAAIAALVFAEVLLFDAVLGMVALPLHAHQGMLTVIAGIALVGLLIKEATGF